MPGALTELEVIYCVKQWGTISGYHKSPNVPVCLSVELQSLGVWPCAMLLFDGPLGLITSLQISNYGFDPYALRTLNFVTFGLLEYW